MANENKNDKILLSEEGLEKLNAELRELIDVKRPEIIKAIQEAREQGDLSENADYDAAKNQQGEIEKRIQEIKNILTNYELINEANDTTSNEKVKVGSKVKILDLSDNEEYEYEIVGEVEADPDNNKIGQIAKRPNAADCKSATHGFSGSNPLLSTILGCSQAVRHQILILTCGGSNPPYPAKFVPLAQW